jgi:hypothetical protein
MPTYTFKNNNTGEIEEYTMRIAELDKFKEDNPHLERSFSREDLPGLGDGMRMSVPGAGKADSTFEKYVINRIKEQVPGNTLGKSHKTKMQREW